MVYKEGDRVEGDFKEKGVWYPGVISCNRDDGTYNIEYDDNSIFKEYKVPPMRIRRVRQSITITHTHSRTHTHTRRHSHRHKSICIDTVPYNRAYANDEKIACIEYQSGSRSASQMSQ